MTVALAAELWEAKHGAFTEEELAEAADKLGWPWPPEREASQ